MITIEEHLWMCPNCQKFAIDKRENGVLTIEREDMNIKDLVEQTHANAFNKGFWDKEPNMGEKIALCHSELSEALEALRTGDEDNFAEELADTVIRIFDLCGYLKIDLENEIIKKHKRNLERPAKHGKKF